MTCSGYGDRMTHTDGDRYTRLRQLGWDMDVLRRSIVLVVGAGALGNEIIKNLALAGLGNLLIIDPDTIESHNLTRSVLFRASDVGKSKCAVAAAAAAEIEPGMNARWFQSNVQETLGLGVFKEVDVVLGAVDNLQTRRDINANCMRTGTTFIDGGLYFLDGDVRIFTDKFSVCFDCTLTEDEREDGRRRWSCLGLASENGSPVGPTAPTIASMVGGLQAQLALKYLHRGQPAPYPMRVPSGTRIRFNGIADEYESWALNRDPTCPTHLTAESISEATVRRVALSNDVVAEELLQKVQGEFGAESYVDLGFDLVFELSCVRCGRTERCLKRQGSMTFLDTMCPVCTVPNCHQCGRRLAESAFAQSDMVFPDRIDCAFCFESTPVIIRENSMISRLDPESPGLSHTLSQLTVPLMDILEIKGAKGDEPTFVQLDGDRERVFEAPYIRGLPNT